MLISPRHRIHKLSRTRQIFTRLVFYGFGELTEALGFRRHRLLSSPVGEIVRGRRVRRLPFGARLRLLFEDLGPTFIKLGQLLSLRSDLIPEEITSELSRLQYGAAPLPFAKLEPLLEEQWGAQWRRKFRSIDTNPLASASIAQVHRAVTLEGREVVLKIQRPGIPELIRSDLSLLGDLALLLERYLPRSRGYKPRQLVDHFSKVLALELDFLYEGRTMDLVRKHFEHNSDIHVPELHWPLCSNRILVMEYIEGTRLSEETMADSVDTHRIAEIGARYVLTQVFDHGVYNADPHPANFIVRPDGVLTPLDFGMIGILDEEMKQALVNMLMAFVNKDPDKLMRVFFSLELLDETARRSELSYDLSRLINYYHRIPVAHLSVTRMLQDLNTVIRRYPKGNGHRGEPGAASRPGVRHRSRGQALCGESTSQPAQAVDGSGEDLRSTGRHGQAVQLSSLRRARASQESTQWKAQTQPGSGGSGSPGAGDRQIGQQVIVFRGHCRSARSLLLFHAPSRRSPAAGRTASRTGRLRCSRDPGNLVPDRHSALRQAVAASRPADPDSHICLSPVCEKGGIVGSAL